MRIVFVEIENFRGIKKLEWAPAAKVNCLIGPGDFTETTILDAIELALNPRSGGADASGAPTQSLRIPTPKSK
jgi:putative ATP-dependent endonuclease of the OLD family